MFEVQPHLIHAPLENMLEPLAVSLPKMTLLKLQMYYTLNDAFILHVSSIFLVDCFKMLSPWLFSFPSCAFHLRSSKTKFTFQSFTAFIAPYYSLDRIPAGTPLYLSVPLFTPVWYATPGLLNFLVSLLVGVTVKSSHNINAFLSFLVCPLACPLLSLFLLLTH